MYIDDIIVFSKTSEKHFVCMENVYIRLKQNGLKSKPSKCEFFTTEVKYLWHIASDKGI